MRGRLPSVLCGAMGYNGPVLISAGRVGCRATVSLKVRLARPRRKPSYGIFPVGIERRHDEPPSLPSALDPIRQAHQAKSDSCLSGADDTCSGPTPTPIHTLSYRPTSARDYLRMLHEAATQAQRKQRDPSCNQWVSDRLGLGSNPSSPAKSGQARDKSHAESQHLRTEHAAVAHAQESDVPGIHPLLAAYVEAALRPPSSGHRIQSRTG